MTRILSPFKLRDSFADTKFPKVENRLLPY